MSDETSAVGFDPQTMTDAGDRRGLVAGALDAVDRIKGAVAGASLSLATAMSGAGATCATGRCGQGCGYACGLIGVTAAGGIVVTAIRRRLREKTEEIG